MRAVIADAAPDLLKALLERALAGDVGAARLIMERAIPPLRATEQTQPLTLPDGSLSEQGKAVLAAVAAGELAPSQGAALMGAVAALARVVEIDELEKRIKALEGRTNDD